MQFEHGYFEKLLLYNHSSPNQSSLILNEELKYEDQS